MCNYRHMRLCFFTLALLCSSVAFSEMLSDDVERFLPQWRGLVEDKFARCAENSACYCQHFDLEKPLPEGVGVRFSKSELCPMDEHGGNVFWNRTYRSDGTVVDQGLLVEGKFHGTWTGWHANGQIAGERHYEMGEDVGLHRSWHENGQLQWEERYRDGEAEGVWRRWSANGVLELELKWSNGEVVSKDCYVPDVCG